MLWFGLRIDIYLFVFLSNDDLFLNDDQNGFEPRKSLFVYIGLWSIHLLPTQLFICYLRFIHECLVVRHLSYSYLAAEADDRLKRSHESES